MNIAILGAGNVGGSLASAAVKAGHEVVVSASSAASAQEAAATSGAHAAGSNAEAVAAADVVVLAVPHGAVAGIVDEVGDALTGKVVVDATNPLNDTYSDLTTSGGSAAEQLQQQLPSAAVVKALNTVFASRYSTPTEDGQPLDAFLAADDEQAKTTVSELVQSLGFRPVDVGGLRMARTLEELAFANISLNATHGWTWQSAFRLVGPQATA
jgi:8-hydroxy-5-deazaflavin:NADPH oxidoreductase